MEPRRIRDGPAANPPWWKRTTASGSRQRSPSRVRPSTAPHKWKRTLKETRFLKKVGAETFRKSSDHHYLPGKKCPYSEDRRDSNLKKSREKYDSVATYWKGTFQKGTMAFGKNDIRFSANRVLWHTFSYATTRRFDKIHTADLYLQNNRITHTSVPADLWCPARKKCFKKPLLHIQPPEQKGRHQKRYVQV